jgi:hypothetical protein
LPTTSFVSADVQIQAQTVAVLIALVFGSFEPVRFFDRNEAPQLVGLYALARQIAQHTRRQRRPRPQLISGSLFCSRQKAVQWDECSMPSMRLCSTFPRSPELRRFILGVRSMSVPRNLPIDCRRHRTSLRSPGAGTSASSPPPRPGEANNNIIIGSPQAPELQRRPDPQSANKKSLKRKLALRRPGVAPAGNH